MAALELNERIWLSVKDDATDLVKWRSQICSCILEEHGGGDGGGDGVGGTLVTDTQTEH